MSKESVRETQTDLSRHVQVEQVVEAQDGNSQEHNLRFWEALRLYPKSVLWSLAMSTAVIMEGYDTMLIGTFYAQPAFQRAYGKDMGDGSYQIPAPWQAGLSNGSSVGQLMGLLIGGYVSERFGFRKTMLAGMMVVTGFIFILFFAPNLKVLLAGSILFGIPLGLFQTTTVIYALEMSPLCLRPYLTNYVDFCWSFGKIIGAGVARGTLPLASSWAYRIPFGIQWLWPVILIPIFSFAPESPWWLVRTNQLDRAKDVLEGLTSKKNAQYDIDKNIALMVVTTEHERALNSETTYRACFKGTNLRRTLVVIGIYCIQNMSGNSLRAYATYFLQQAGLPTTQAFNMTLVNLAVAISAGFFSWALLPLFGRRTIYFWNLVFMLIIMTLMGALGIPQAESSNPSYSWAIGALLIISSFIYASSIGPLTNTLCSEIPSALVRSKSIALARWSYFIMKIGVGVLTPYQLNPTAWNWSAKTGFFYAGACLISVVFTFFYVPEPKNRTTAELDILFERGVPARHFSKTPVNLAEALYADKGKQEA